MQWSAYSRVGIVNNGAHNALFVKLPLLICVVKIAYLSIVQRHEREKTDAKSHTTSVPVWRIHAVLLYECSHVRSQRCEHDRYEARLTHWFI